MKILLTGAAGILGKPLVAALVEQGYEVVPYDLKDGKDIHNQSRLDAAMTGCDVVIHLAGIPHPLPHLEWPEYFQANVLGTELVAETAVKQGVKRLVFASSTAYYGAHRGFPFDPGDGIDEQSPNAVQRYATAEMPDMAIDYNRAALAYACSKVAAESVLAPFGLGQRIEVVILRMSPLKGDRQPYEFGLLLYLENAVKAVTAAVTLPGGWYEIYNVANEDVTAVNMDKWTAAQPKKPKAKSKK